MSVPNVTSFSATSDSAHLCVEPMPEPYLVSTREKLQFYANANQTLSGEFKKTDIFGFWIQEEDEEVHIRLTYFAQGRKTRSEVSLTIGKTRDKVKAKEWVDKVNSLYKS